MDREAWNARYAAQSLLWNVDPDPFLGAEVGDIAPGRVLDLGAGEGRTALWLAARGWLVTAVDFSDVAIARGRQRAEKAGLADSISWLCQDLHDYSPAGHTFDLALSMFIHLSQPARRRLFGEVVASLAPGATMLVVGYDTSNATEGEGGPRDPAVLFSPEDIVDDLGGLRIERAERLRVGDAIDAVVRAVKA